MLTVRMNTFVTIPGPKYSFAEATQRAYPYVFDCVCVCEFASMWTISRKRDYRNQSSEKITAEIIPLLAHSYRSKQFARNPFANYWNTSKFMLSFRGSIPWTWWIYVTRMHRWQWVFAVFTLNARVTCNFSACKLERTSENARDLAWQAFDYSCAMCIRVVFNRYESML